MHRQHLSIALIIMQRPSTAPTLLAVASVGSAPVDATACALAFSDPNSTNVLSILQQVQTQFQIPESHITISKHHSATTNCLQAVDQYVAAAALPVPVAARDPAFSGQVSNLCICGCMMHDA